MTDELAQGAEEFFDKTVHELTKAVAFAVDATDIADDLPEGVEWEFDSVDAHHERTGKAGRFIISGRRFPNSEWDDDEVEIVVQIKHINYGPNKIIYEKEVKSAEAG